MKYDPMTILFMCSAGADALGLVAAAMAYRFRAKMRDWKFWCLETGEWLNKADAENVKLRQEKAEALDLIFLQTEAIDILRGKLRPLEAAKAKRDAHLRKVGRLGSRISALNRQYRKEQAKATTVEALPAVALRPREEVVADVTCLTEARRARRRAEQPELFGAPAVWSIAAVGGTLADASPENATYA